jgi:hypothetical protein
MGDGNGVGAVVTVSLLVLFLSSLLTPSLLSWLLCCVGRSPHHGCHWSTAIIISLLVPSYFFPPLLPHIDDFRTIFREIFMVLRDNFLFENWTRLKLEKLTNLCNKRIFEEGEYLFRQVLVRELWLDIGPAFMSTILFNCCHHFDMLPVFFGFECEWASCNPLYFLTLLYRHHL